MDRLNGNKHKVRIGKGILNHKIIELPKKFNEFIGEETAMSTIQFYQRIWQHIRLNSLQNPENLREIICDSKLELLFNAPSINFFEIVKILSQVQTNLL
jgi:upstream activation factor subunit UAF30